MFDLALPLQVFIRTSLELSLMLCLQYFKYGVQNNFELAVLVFMSIYMFIMFACVFYAIIKKILQQDPSYTEKSKFRALWQDLKPDKKAS